MANLTSISISNGKSISFSQSFLRIITNNLNRVTSKEYKLTQSLLS